MGDKGLERSINPWMFDKSGNLTSAAQRQFPDSSGTPAPISTINPGQGLLVDSDVLKACGERAEALGSHMATELGGPGLDVTDATTSLIGFDSCGALGTAWDMWQQQSQILSGLLTTIGQNLIEGAWATQQADEHIAAQFRSR